MRIGGTHRAGDESTDVEVVSLGDSDEEGEGDQEEEPEEEESTETRVAREEAERKAA